MARPTHFAQTLFDVRTAAKLRQCDLARLVGRSQSRIARLETGMNAPPAPEELDALCNALPKLAVALAGTPLDAPPRQSAVVSATTRLEDLPEFLRVADCARVLCINRTTAYLLVQSGQLRSVRLGRVLRVPRAAIEQLALGTVTR